MVEFPRKTLKLLKETKADKAIKNSMSPDDLAGVYIEARGVTIPKKNSEPFSYINEAEHALSSFKNVLDSKKSESIIRRIQELNEADQFETHEVRLLKEKLSDLIIIKDSYTRYLRKAKCPNEMT